jgi:ribonuclease PH
MRTYGAEGRTPGAVRRVHAEREHCEHVAGSWSTEKGHERVRVIAFEDGETVGWREFAAGAPGRIQGVYP